MDEIKAITTGLIIGGALGWGLVMAGVVLCPAIPFIAGTGLTVVFMISGAAAGGNLGLKIAEKINKEIFEREALNSNFSN